MSDHTFDVIVIGSGMGGMTAASLLCQLYNKRVLIVEKHWTFGGLTHEFKRGNNAWEVGLHYIGDMGENQETQHIFNFVTGYGVTMQKMPDTYDYFHFPDLTFGYAIGTEALTEDLCTQFPQEAEAIKQYIKDIAKYRSYIIAYLTKQFVPAFGNARMNAYFELTTEQYLNKHFKDDRLKGLLSATCGNYGVLPSRSAFLTHALITQHYMHGGYYPEGGPKVIGEQVMQILEKHGGKVLLGAEVTEIITENDQAVGVRLRKKSRDGFDTYYAPHIISNAGAQVTYEKLLPKHPFADILADIEAVNNPNSFVCLYVSFKESPANLNFDGANHWLVNTYNSENFIPHIYEPAFPAMLYLSFPTLKGHLSGSHTAEIMCLVPYADFADWKEQPWMKRDEAYKALKADLQSRMLAEIEKHFPGFTDLIEYVEMSTPLSLEKFTSRKYGAAYGLMGTPQRYQLPWLKTFTPIKNLYLSGQDVCSTGIVGAMMGGVAGAAAVLGENGFFTIMSQITQLQRKRRSQEAVVSE